MKAVLMMGHGGREVLRSTEFPDPTPGWGEALVRVRACGLNHLDVWVRKGLPNVRLAFPHILGSDMAGEIERVEGSEDLELRTGQRVVLFPALTCGRCMACVSGRNDMCPQFKLFGEHVRGGYAERIAVPLRNLVPLPDRISFAEAACVPVAYLTAWHMIVSRAEVRHGEWVLVTAAASGVSTGAIQIAKIFGAKVIAAASTRAKLEMVRELGADFEIDYSKPDWAEEIRRITSKHGVDVIIDHVGQSKWSDYIRCLAWGGRLVLCGASSGHEGMTDLRHVFFRRLSILGSTMGSLHEFRQLMSCVAEGKVRGVIHKVLPLSEASEAHRILEDREVVGKVILEIG